MVLQILYITLLAVVANFVGTLSGFGLGTIMTPVMLLFLPFGQALFLICIIHWFHNIWKILLFKKGINWGLFFYFGIPGIIFSYLGASLVQEGSAILRAMFGGFLIMYVLFLFIRPTFSIPSNWKSALLGGAISGFSAGIFGIRGATKSAFLTAYNLPKASYLVTVGAISFLIDTTRLLTYYFSEGIRLEQSLVWGLLIFIPASFLGAKIGQYFVNFIPQRYFRSLVALFLLILGVRLLLFPF